MANMANSYEMKLKMLQDALNKRQNPQIDTEAFEDAASQTRQGNVLNNVNQAMALVGGYKPVVDFSKQGEAAMAQAKQAEMLRQQGNQEARDTATLGADFLKSGQSLAAGDIELGQKRTLDREFKQAREADPRVIRFRANQLTTAKKEAEAAGNAEEVGRISQELNDLNQYQKTQETIKMLEASQDPSAKGKIGVLRNQLNRIKTPSMVNMADDTKFAELSTKPRIVELDALQKEANIGKTLAETGKLSREKFGGAGKQLPPNVVLTVNEGNAIPAMLKDVEKVIASNAGSFGPVAGMLKYSPYAEKAKTIQSQVNASSQAFGRFMEGGVLRKEDEEKYRKMFPQVTDTPVVAANKLAIVNKLLIDKQKSNLEALKGAGYDVSSLDKSLGDTKLPDVLGIKDNSIKPGQVRVSNGTESHIIDTIANPNDLAEAQKEGFQVVK